MMAYVRRTMIWVCGYASGLGFFFILMAIIFWYYFSRIKARELADADLPKDFQDLDIEAANFADEDKVSAGEEPWAELNQRTN